MYDSHMNIHSKIKMKIRRQSAALLRWMFFIISRLEFLLDHRSDKTVVLYGEKNGYEARDSAFQQFIFNNLTENEAPRLKHVYVINKRSVDLDHVKSSKKPFVIQNSLSHFRMVHRAKILVINDGYLDVCPRIPRILHRFDTPFLYLQHGIVRYKKLFFNRSHYLGRILRFVTTLPEESNIVRTSFRSAGEHRHCVNLTSAAHASGWTEKVQTADDLRRMSYHLDEIAEGVNFIESRQHLERQAKFSRYLADRSGLPAGRVVEYGLPRFDRLAELVAQHAPNRDGRIAIALFFTWRDKNFHRSQPRDSAPIKPIYMEVLESIASAFSNSTQEIDIYVLSHQKDGDIDLTLCHSLLEREKHLKLHLGHDDFQELMIKTDLLITDYSSIAFDFNFANTPVLFYQPDYEDYVRTRGTYVKFPNEWIGKRSHTPEELRLNLEQWRNEEPKMVSSNSVPFKNFGKSRESISKYIASRQPSFLFIVYNIYGVGGTIRAVTNLANYLYEKGFHVEILSLRRNATTPVLGLDSGVRVYSAQDDRKGKRRGLAKLLSRIPSIFIHRDSDLYGRLNLLIDLIYVARLRLTNADIIVPTFPGLVPVALRFKRKSARVFVQEHKIFDAYPKDIQRLIRAHYPKLLGLSVLTEAETDFYDKKKVHVVPNGLPVETKPVVTSRDKEIVALGRLDSQKQFDVLIAAFSRIACVFPDWQLKVYGGGREHDALKAQIAELGLDDQVFLMGQTSQPLDILQSASICAFTSEYEGFGMVYIEAFASLCPVITFDVEGGPKVFAHDRYNCLKAKSFDVNQYADLLAELMQNADLRDQLAENGWKTFEKTYQMRSIGEKFLRAVQAD